MNNEYKVRYKGKPSIFKNRTLKYGDICIAESIFPEVSKSYVLITIGGIRYPFLDIGGCTKGNLPKDWELAKDDEEPNGSYVEKVIVEKVNYKTLNYRIFDRETHSELLYTLNLDTYELSITGESIAYYRWNTSPTESFLQIMTRCSESYLLNKLFKKTEFDIEKSIADTIEELNNYYILDDEAFFEISKEIAALREADEPLSKEAYHEEVKMILEDYGIRFYEDSVCIVMDYTEWDKLAIEYFIYYIVPELIKEM